MRFEDAYEGWAEKRLTQIDAAHLLGVCTRTFRRTPATARRAGFNRYEEDCLDGLIDTGRTVKAPHRTFVYSSYRYRYWISLEPTRQRIWP